MTLDELNQLDAAKAYDGFLQCCGSQTWASRMTAGRPFPDVDRLLQFGETIWQGLPLEDWLEAFSKHPMIGESRKLSKLSAEEQSGMGDVQDQKIHRLEELNEAYAEKFGWIYIVCATGKSAPEMLGLLESRISNEPTVEMQMAAAEQAKITELRIGKLLADEPHIYSRT